MSNCKPAGPVAHAPTSRSSGLTRAGRRLQAPVQAASASTRHRLSLHGSLRPHFPASPCLLKKSRNCKGINFESSNFGNFLSFPTLCTNLRNLEELPSTTQATDAREQQASCRVLAQHQGHFADDLEVRKRQSRLKYHSTHTAHTTN